MHIGQPCTLPYPGMVAKWSCLNNVSLRLIPYRMSLPHALERHQHYIREHQAPSNNYIHHTYFDSITAFVFIILWLFLFCRPRFSRVHPNCAYSSFAVGLNTLSPRCQTSYKTITFGYSYILFLRICQRPLLHFLQTLFESGCAALSPKGSRSDNTHS